MTAEPAGSGRTLPDWQALALAARRHGEYLEVIDLARRGLEEHPGDLRLEYEKTLAYARAGAVGEAAANLRALRLAGALDAIPDKRLRTDFGALEPRLLKDQAFATTGAAGAALAHKAAAAYEAVYDATGEYFPAINAATLYGIAGETARSRALARVAIAGAQAEPPSYYGGATIAEAQLLLGDAAAAAAALREAVASGVHLDELAATRRQLAWLCSHLAQSGGTSGSEMVAALPAPFLLCWQADPSEGEPSWSTEPIRALASDRLRGGLPVLAYGAVISPADIVVAEVLTAAGAHVNLVIACRAEACLEAMARRAGAEWGERLARALQAARSVTEVTLEGDSAERTVARMALQQSWGLAAMRAAALVTRVHGLRVGVDGLTDLPPPQRDASADWAPADGRMSRAFVFGDIKGFSTLGEAEHRPFLEHVIGGFADAIAPLGDQVEYTETAGDGIYVVVTNVIAALRLCHDLQAAMDPARMVAAGLPPTLALRLGAHVGPVATGMDRVTGRIKFIGKEVIRTARIEAITPVGQTYVTEQFAAILHSLTPVGHACEYVGWQAMAKGFGRCRMYSLRPTPAILALLQG